MPINTPSRAGCAKRTSSSFRLQTKTRPRRLVRIEESQRAEGAGGKDRYRPSLATRPPQNPPAADWAKNFRCPQKMIVSTVLVFASVRMSEDAA
ncbi:hypothetical protein E2C01_013442 [Portunus trituberculatus]|uniref:Uncharacterized protein n=1 Tax=Portunus trituberculatus TaxID=210409 RepID=A0A5B7DHA5_PORTR|nr:hypothetical protein [Portunus trituberculatus]